MNMKNIIELKPREYIHNYIHEHTSEGNDDLNWY